MSALTRRRRPAATLTAALALTVAVLACAFAWQSGRQRPDLSGLDEARLTRELEGLGYPVHAEPADRALPSGRVAWAGLYAARPEVADSWDDITSRSHATASAWRGVVLAKRQGTAWEPGIPGESVAVGPWILSGYPDELDRVAQALGLPR
jgi:hypothetical protein